MKLYSKRQVIFFSVCVAALTILCSAVVFSAYTILNNTSNKTKTELVQTDAQQDNFALQTSNPVDSEMYLTQENGFSQDELQNITIYEKYQDAVVNITTEIVGVNWFLEPVVQEGGSGSGAIIDTRGYVVTNVHVISGASKIYVSLSDGTQYEGSIIGTDTASDIAVVKFEPPKNMDITTIDFGNSANLKVGQKVLAIGNPFGFERTLTTGIISGLGRPIQTSRSTVIRDMIQTDTAINPGNSGGPLLDAQGRMIGINTMIYSTSGSSAGVGFAVPIDTARRVVSDLIQFGTVRRGEIDATFVQLTSAIANYAELSVNQGLLVSQTVRNGNAERAGLRGGTQAVRYGSSRNSTVIYIGGDVITALDGEPVRSLADYYSLLESKKPGDTISVTVMRGRQQQNLSVELAAAPTN